MSISARIEYVPAGDLLDEPVPTERAPRRTIGRRRRLVAALAALAGLPLLTLLLHGTGDALSLEGEVLLFLLAVVGVALIGGMLVAVPAAVAAALLINFYFVDPKHTLDVAHADQAVALVVFVVVAIVVSALVEVAARRARAAEFAAAQAETLSALAGADLDEADTLRAILDRARRTFAMESVTLLTRDGHGGWDVVERSGWSSGDVAAPLRFDVPIGQRLRLVGRGPALFAEDQRILEAFAAAAETAFHGQRLARQAQRARELATVDRQRTALLAAVGHDLRTPLAGIKAAVSSLRQRDVTFAAEDREKLLETIERSADRLHALVTNLLDASRLEAGALTVRCEPVSLVEVATAAVLAVPDAAGRVELDVPEDLPLVLADPGLLERVLANLVDNAVRHGGSAHPVRLTAGAGAESAKIAVIDHGPGVPAAHREELFTPFHRLGTDGGDGGAGLGLAVARGLAEAMGGALVADGSDGGGLTMRLRVPLAPRTAGGASP